MSVTEVVCEVDKRCECGKLLYVVREGIALIKCPGCGKEVPIVQERQPGAASGNRRPAVDQGR